MPPVILAERRIREAFVGPVRVTPFHVGCSTHLARNVTAAVTGTNTGEAPEAGACVNQPPQQRLVGTALQHLAFRCVFVRVVELDTQSSVIEDTLHKVQEMRMRSPGTQRSHAERRERHVLPDEPIFGDT